MTDTSIKDFEAAIGELETIVKTLEAGDLALEQSLELYERGVQLSRFCHARLEEAERRIEILNERGELKPAPASFAADTDRTEVRDSHRARGIPHDGASPARRGARSPAATAARLPRHRQRGDALQRFRRRQAAAPGSDAGRRRRQRPRPAPRQR